MALLADLSKAFERVNPYWIQLGTFAKVKCKCKSKSNIIVNAPLGARSLHKVETSSFGVQAIQVSPRAIVRVLVGASNYGTSSSIVGYN